MLENKLRLKTEAELAVVEERISKIKAHELFDKGILDTLEVGTFLALSQIHKYLFDEIYSLRLARLQIQKYVKLMVTLKE